MPRSSNRLRTIFAWLLPASWLRSRLFWLGRIIRFPTARYCFKFIREPTKFFPRERVKATSNRLVAAGRKSTKVRGVHLPKPAQCAKPISVPKCAVGDNRDRHRNGSQAVEGRQPYSGPLIGPPTLRMALIQQTRKSPPARATLGKFLVIALRSSCLAGVVRNCLVVWAIIRHVGSSSSTWLPPGFAAASVAEVDNRVAAPRAHPAHNVSNKPAINERVKLSTRCDKEGIGAN